MNIVRSTQFPNRQQDPDDQIDSPGTRLKHIRFIKNLTIKELASVIHVSEATIINVEKNYCLPSLPTLQRLSQVLDVPIHFLGCFEQLPEQTFGEKLKKARLYSGLTKRELAEQLGIDAKTIYNWESGSRAPLNQSLHILKEFIENTLR